MKTTVEIADSIYQKIKARSSLKGQTVKSFFQEAAIEKLQRETESVAEEQGWMRVFGKASPEEAAKVQAVIDEEFSRVSDEDWKSAISEDAPFTVGNSLDAYFGSLSKEEADAVQNAVEELDRVQDAEFRK